MAEQNHVLRCRCGSVECTVEGPLIGKAVCYCDDCQAGAKQIEALGDGPPVADPDGGTALSLARLDKFAVTKGKELLVAHKLKAQSPTNRYATTCCNSGMYIGFDKGPFWVSAISNRFVGTRPKPDMRIQTRFRESSLPYPDNAPVYKTFPKSFMFKLISEWIKMKFGR